MRQRSAASWMLLLLCWIVTPTQAEPAQYAIDPEHCSIGFRVHHMGYERVLGLFRKAQGSYTFDEATGQLSNVSVVVDAASVTTGHDKRDAHLRGGDFLDTSHYPQMVFTASATRPAAAHDFVIEGELQLLGTKRPLTLQATLNKIGTYPIGPALGKKPYVMGVSAQGRVKRSEFGMKYAVDNGWVGDEVELLLEFEARRQ